MSPRFYLKAANGGNGGFAQCIWGSLPSGGVQRLLLVDDEPDILETVVMLLAVRLPDVQVTAVGGGFDALAQLELQRFDAILTDYKMPGMDGAELVRAIRARWPKMQVLMFTAFMDTGTLAEIHSKVPELRIVPKPLDVDFLIEQLLVALPAV